jgi:LPXTG-motif cell wall-anchored protein
MTTITAAGSTTSIGEDTTTTVVEGGSTTTTPGGSPNLPFTGSGAAAQLVLALSFLAGGGLLALRRRNAQRI